MKRTILAFLCCIFAAAATAQAGTAGIVTGMVTDEAGKPMADVIVRLASPTDNETVHTDAKGYFSLLRLVPDTYTISMEKSGYWPVSYAGVAVFADNTLALRFKIEKAFPEYHIDHFGTFTSQLFKPEVPTDEMNLSPSPFQNYPNPFEMSLSTVPGVLVGSGWSYLH